MKEYGIMKECRFNIWFKDLQTLAEKRKLSYLIGDKESHRESWEDGESLEDELFNQIDAAQRSL